ncbi:MAG: hypothetical protein AB7E81_21295 [Hyphomicrobiaceae bacterium]
MGKPPRGKRPTKPTGQLGTYGERVGRERAARRRAARERGAAEHKPRDGRRRPDVAMAEPEFIEIPQSDLANELSVLAVLITSGLVRSHPEARRCFRDVGILVNDVPILSDKAKICLTDISPEGLIKLSLGDGRRVLLRPC